MRSLLPADSLVYIESDDLAALVKPVFESENFRRAAVDAPNIQLLKDVQIAVGVTGFQTNEQTVDGEQSIGVVRPLFVAVIDSNAWNYQVLAFVEDRFAPYIEGIYGINVRRETKDQHGGRLFSWSVADGRSSFVFVAGDVIYFANDRSTLEKALAVRRGESDSFAAGRSDDRRDPNKLARGFVTKDGVDQIASLAGIYVATQASDDDVVRAAVANVVPMAVRSSVDAIRFDVSSDGKQYFDRVEFTLKGEAAQKFAATAKVKANASNELSNLIPADAVSVTQYDLADLRASYSAFVDVLSANLQGPLKAVVPQVADLFFESYGIDKADQFLSGIGPGAITIRDQDGSDGVAIFNVTDEAKAFTAMDANTAKSAVAAVRPELGSIWVIGDIELANRCLQAFADPSMRYKLPMVANGTEVPAAIRSLIRDEDSMPSLIAAVTGSDPAIAIPPTLSITETSFDDGKMYRSTRSEISGLLSMMIGLIGQD